MLTTIVFWLAIMQGMIFTSNDISISDEICLSNEEKKLYEIINQYRKEKNLPAVPLSAALTKVAQVHAKDLMENYQINDQCNPHSWSDKGSWTACCYTNDHKQPTCMWDKPKEIAGYENPGYEIAYWHSREAIATNALESWKKSKGHNMVMINEGQWNQATWQAMGVGIYKQYAIVWFGQMNDIVTVQKLCE